MAKSPSLYAVNMDDVDSFSASGSVKDDDSNPDNDDEDDSDKGDESS